MARLVRFTQNGPIKIEPPLEKPIWICACGLSQTFPICDGSHKACRLAETEPGKLYIYDTDRRTIVETRDDDAADRADQPPPT